ncbi:AAA family ATPase [Desulfovibrio sp. JC010]|uniref:AAA family ATPase n=1 Tax=Desulfovibrio sp. JC010 TaxID=2593641 RepID=UPI0013D151F3|nr:AAA family ATPase [Desulfovibrio sp. JC010]NDV25557.1 ATP-binding protein [Desulfovibrio sp. JC010]
MKLLIENFYNIKHAELDFKKFNILIGPQAAGKSLIAKVLYFMEDRILHYSAHELADPDIETKEFNKDSLKLFYSIFEKKSLDINFKLTISNNINRTWEFTYTGFNPNDLKDITLSETQENPSISSAVKTVVQHALENNIDFAKSMGKKFNSEIDKDAFLSKVYNYIVSGLPPEADTRRIFIPASRSLVNTISDNSFWMTENNVDFLLNKFGQIYSRQIKKDTEDAPIECYQLSSIIKGNIERSNNEYFINENGRTVALSNASSGQQAATPILIGLNRVQNKDIFHAFIEEPEAHIFPEAQYLLTRYISEIHNHAETKITLTTHSPYILTAVNTLIYAGTVGKQSEAKAAKVKEIIPEDQWLNSEDVAAYMVEADGAVRSIMDEETGLIEADSIDDVSDVIGAEFNKLLDIEFDEEGHDE